MYNIWSSSFGVFSLLHSGIVLSWKFWWFFSFFMRFLKFSLLKINILQCQVDIWGIKYLFLPLEWIGMNAMLVYVMAAEGIFAGFINGWYYEDPHNTLVCSNSICFCLHFPNVITMIFVLIIFSFVVWIDLWHGQVYWIQKHIFVGVWHSRRVGILLYVLFAEILFWGIVAGILHWLGIYWKL